MKILVISENIPRRDFSSGDRRFLGILQILAGNHTVVFCIPSHQPWLETAENEKRLDYLKELGIEVMPLNRGLFDEAIRKETWDIGFFEFYWFAERFLDRFIRFQPQAVTIIDSVDLHFAREETQAGLGLISAKKARITRSRELLVYRAADITIAVSWEDRQRLQEAGGIRHIAFVPNVIATVPRNPGPREPAAIFIGCYAWPPNVDAMRWFVSEVWPQVISERPDARMMIVGSQAPEEILAMAHTEGVEVVGYVPDTAPYLDAAAVSVAPLRYGGGMKGKVNESLAHGLPVVATSIGAQGFNARDGEEMFVADDPVLFARRVLQLLNDPGLREKMGLAGQQLNESICSPEVIGQFLGEMLAQCESIRHNRRRVGWARIWRLKLNRFKVRCFWKKFV